MTDAVAAKLAAMISDLDGYITRRVAELRRHVDARDRLCDRWREAAGVSSALRRDLPCPAGKDCGP